MCWSWESGPTSLDRNEVDDAFGEGLAIGDFNGDGFPDAAVGAPGEDTGGVSNVGRIYVYLGSERGFQPWRVLSSADFGVTEAANNALGVELAAGDFDDDGYADLAAAFGGIPGSVATIVVAYGEPEGFRDHTVFELSDIDPSMRTDAIHLGHALSVGDYDDDGIDDLAVGAEEYPLDGMVNAGAVFLLDGNWSSGLTPGSRVDLNDGLIWALADDRFGGSLATHRQSADDFLVIGMPGYGWVLTYEGGVYGGPYSNGSYPNFGTRVAVGDLNGDGIPDPLASGSSGSSIVVVGTTNPIASFSPSGATSIHPLAVRDIDGDGNDDLLAVSNASGHHLLLYEGDGTLVPDPWIELDPPARQHANDALGMAALLVDIDGDNALDVVAGAAVPSVGAGAGRVYAWAVSDPLDWATDPDPAQVIDQNTSFAGCLDWTSPAECAHVSEATHCARCWSWTDGGPASLDRNEGVVLAGVPADQFGFSTAVADFNGDGYPDLAVGAPQERRDQTTAAGQVYVYLGSERGFQPWVALDDNSGYGPTTSARFGGTLHAVDIDDDGYSDLFVSTHTGGSDPPLYGFRGSPTGLDLEWQWRLSDIDPSFPLSSQPSLGREIVSGDFDHDGDDDLAVTAPGNSRSSSNVGRVYVLAYEAGEFTVDATFSYVGAAGLSLAVTSDDFLVVGRAAVGQVYVYDDGALLTTFQTMNALAGFGKSVAMADVDGDATEEVLVGGLNATHVEVAGVGALIAGTVSQSVWTRVLGAGDLNGDGYNDIVLVHKLTSTNVYQVEIALGDGTLSPPVAFAIDSVPSGLLKNAFGDSGTVADLDGDGYSDLVAGAWGPSSVGGYVYTYVAPHGYGEHPWDNPFDPTQIIHQELALESCDACVVNAWPDGTVCDLGAGDEICVADACVVRGCGDGWREPPPGTVDYPREGCDDGNTYDFDLCSSTCEPTTLPLAAVEGGRDDPFGPRFTAGVDGDGRTLIVWSSETTEGYDIVGLPLSTMGAPIATPLPDDPEDSTNLLSDPTNFASSAWITTATLTAGQVDPIAGTSAFLIEDDSSSEQHLRQSVAVVADERYVATIWIAQDSDQTRFPELRIDDPDGMTSYRVQLDTVTGAVATVSGGVSGQVDEPISGWWRLAISFEAGATGNALFHVLPAAGTTLGVADATATGTITAWGAALRAGSLPLVEGITITTGLPLGVDASPSVAGLPDGGWVVTWSAPGADAADAGVVFRMVGPDGTLGPIRIATEEQYLDQLQPSVAASDSGFLIAWTDTSRSLDEAPARRVLARHFDLDGNATSSDFVVSVDATRDHGDPVVSASADVFLVAWVDRGGSPADPTSVRARRFDASVAIDADDLVIAASYASQVALATLATGNFVAVWRDGSVDPYGDIYGRRIAASGDPLVEAAEAVVTSSSPYSNATADVAPSVAALSGDEYLVVYQYTRDERGLGVELSPGASTPPELADLAMWVDDDTAGHGSVVTSPRGVWAVWSTGRDPYEVGAWRSTVAYRLAVD